MNIQYDIKVPLNKYAPELHLNDEPYWDLVPKDDLDEAVTQQSNPHRYWYQKKEKSLNTMTELMQ